MWSDKKPWWQQPKGASKKSPDRQYARNWCVIKVHVGHRQLPNQSDYETVYQYKVVVRSNVPKYWNEARQKYESSAVMENLTQAEAVACAKGLDFFEN